MSSSTHESDVASLPKEERTGNTVLFIDSWAPLSELFKIIEEVGGYRAPLIKINISREKPTQFAFCAVPVVVAEKLVNPEVPLDKTTFKYAVFKRTFNKDIRGLYIRVPQKNSQFAWMRGVVRRKILDTLEQLESRGLIKEGTCSLSAGFKLFINDSNDAVVETVHSFINGQPFYNGKRVYYIKAFYLNPPPSDSTPSPEADKDEVKVAGDIGNTARGRGRGIRNNLKKPLKIVSSTSNRNPRQRRDLESPRPLIVKDSNIDVYYDSEVTGHLDLDPFHEYEGDEPEVTEELM